MKKSLLSILSFSFLMFGACVSGPPEPDPVLLKLDELDSRLGRVESVLNNQSLLDLQSDNDNLSGQLRDLRNQLDNLSFKQETALNSQKNQYLDLDKRLQTMESRPVRQVVVSNSASSSTQAGSVVLTGATGSERDVYQAAFDLLKGGKYSDAALGFESYIQQYPNGQLADNAHYWLGESNYITRKFDKALQSFAIVTQSYPQSRKIADAWLKLGYTYYEMKDTAKAKDALQKTLNAFPDSSAALLAKQRLDRIVKEEG